MTNEEFDALVVEALDSLPDEIGRLMANVEVVVEDEPRPEHLRRLPRGHTLLGLYEGHPLTRRARYSAVMPDKITIFKGPITRVAGTPDGIRDRVRRTVIHEIGHHFGLGERRLRDLGW